MKAAVVKGAGLIPVYGDFEMPVAREGEVLIRVKASALSHLTKGRASGAHYSAANQFPAIAGTDGVGVTVDGRRVYFVMPRAPFGAMAEWCVAPEDQCVEVPEGLDDVTAAAIANPGMSAQASLVERARLVKGETVLINGATGTAGRVAVQLAKYLGASKVIATGRNAVELEELKKIGADIAIAFSLGAGNEMGADEFERALNAEFSRGIDLVIDYLWGESAKTIIVAIAKSVEDGHAVRFVQVGEAGGTGTIALPAAALRSSAIQLMGSGLKSVRLPVLLAGIRSVLDAVGPAGLKIETTALPLGKVEENWAKAAGRPRMVFTID